MGLACGTQNWHQNEWKKSATNTAEQFAELLKNSPEDTEKKKHLLVMTVINDRLGAGLLQVKSRLVGHVLLCKQLTS